MEENLKLFAKRLKELRKEKGYSQEEVARLIGCASSTLYYYEACHPLYPYSCWDFMVSAEI